MGLLKAQVRGPRLSLNNCPGFRCYPMCSKWRSLSHPQREATRRRALGRLPLPGLTHASIRDMPVDKPKSPLFPTRCHEFL